MFALHTIIMPTYDAPYPVIIFHCTAIRTIVHRLYTMYQNPYNGSSFHCVPTPVSTASSNYLHCTNIRTTCRKILLLGDGSQIYQYTPEND